VRELAIAALSQDPPAHRVALFFGQLVQQLDRGGLLRQPLELLPIRVAEVEPLHRQPLLRPRAHRAAAPVGVQLMADDPEQPRVRRSAVGIEAREPDQRLGEALGREVRDRLAVVDAAGEEPEHPVHMAAVELPERLGVAARPEQELAIVRVHEAELSPVPDL
jgi:hypothetical protein